MVDENAYGLWISYYEIEDDEYSLEREPFVQRVTAFRAAVRAHAASRPLGEGAVALDLGHGIHFEVADGDETGSPIQWLKELRGHLEEAGFLSVAVLTHGGRWVEAAAPSSVASGSLEGMEWRSCSLPSEPLRRALYAHAATRQDGDGAVPGWGPGLYLDTEAVEALGKTPKNEPTVLEASGSGATFYRAGS
jgi:hypothetical protein